MALTKEDMAESLFNELGLNKREARELVDEELADQVQAALMAGEIDEGLAFLMWLLITRTLSGQGRPKSCQ